MIDGKGEAMLAVTGFRLIAEFGDEGRNHYHEAVRRRAADPGLTSSGDMP